MRKLLYILIALTLATILVVIIDGGARASPLGAWVQSQMPAAEHADERYLVESLEQADRHVMCAVVWGATSLEARRLKLDDIALAARSRVLQSVRAALYFVMRTRLYAAPNDYIIERTKLAIDVLDRVNRLGGSQRVRDVRDECVAMLSGEQELAQKYLQLQPETTQ